ncbi:MAG: formylglycine-generating enzyme family protein [Pseudomonadota bacterium]
MPRFTSTPAPGLFPALFLLIFALAAGPALALDTCPAGFVPISPGSFTMGALNTDLDAFADELPIHQVEITKVFCMKETEVTQKEWFDVMGTRPWQTNLNPGDYQEGDNYPATGISWDDTQDCIAAKNAQDLNYSYRLPTEAEWEYACRANDPGDLRAVYFFGDDPVNLGTYAWYRDNTVDVGRNYPHETKTRIANDWGLYDMLGNVMEWCSDWYDDDYYSVSPVKDPQGPAPSALLTGKVLRGGSFVSLAAGGVDNCRTSNRFPFAPSADSVKDFGFRIVAGDRVAQGGGSTKTATGGGGGGGGGGCFLGAAR